MEPAVIGGSALVYDSTLATSVALQYSPPDIGGRLANAIVSGGPLLVPQWSLPLVGGSAGAYMVESAGFHGRNGARPLSAGAPPR